MSSHIKSRKTDVLDTTCEFISLHTKDLLNLFSILQTGDELTLLQKTTARLQRIHRELLYHAFSEAVLFREAFYVMKKAHTKEVRERVDKIKHYLEQIGLSAHQVSRILGPDDVMYLPQDEFRVAPIEYDASIVHSILHQTTSQFKKRWKRTRHFIRWSGSILCIVCILGGIVAIPALRQATHTSSLIETVHNKWQHYQNPYVDWLPFVPELPVDPKLGTPMVSVVQETSDEMPRLIASYKQANLDIIETVNMDASASVANNANSKVQVQSDNQEATMVKGNVVYYMTATQPGVNVRPFSKDLEALKAYKEEPDRVEYISQTSQPNQQLDFHVQPLRLPIQYSPMANMLVKVTLPKTGGTYEAYEQSFMQKDSKLTFEVVTTNNAAYFIKNNSNLYGERQANRGSIEVYESGQISAIVIPRRDVQQIVFLGQDDVPWLIRFAKKYLLGT